MIIIRQWAFKPHFRSRMYRWNSSSVAVQRLKEAVAEIRQAARTHVVAAADGSVYLFSRLWPALQDIDTSSGAVGSAVYWTQEQLLPFLVAAKADRPMRDKWLERLWQAIQDDGVDYLCVVQEQWGELCGSPEVASQWADGFIGRVRSTWSDPSLIAYFRGTIPCLSSLLAAGRHQELWDLLAEAPYPSWHERRFGVDALVKEGRLEEALAYAEASRGLNQPESAIAAACERILLDAGRVDEAYARYALTASQSSTGLGTYRALVKKYPGQERARILEDLAAASGDSGRYFAAAKDARLYDLALRFAMEGRTDPRTLIRASRDFLGKQPAFAMAVGRLALERLLQGQGYEITFADVLNAYRHFVEAAAALGRPEVVKAKREAIALATAVSTGHRDSFGDALVRSIEMGRA